MQAMKISFYPFIADEVYQSLLPIKWLFNAAVNGSVMSQQMTLYYRNKWKFNVVKRIFFNVATNGFLMSQK